MHLLLSMRYSISRRFFSCMLARSTMSPASARLTLKTRLAFLTLKNRVIALTFDLNIKKSKHSIRHYKHGWTTQ